MKQAICQTAWPCEPLLKLGEKYKVLKQFFYNGECQVTLMNDDGVEFTTPSVFVEIA